MKEKNKLNLLLGICLLGMSGIFFLANNIILFIVNLPMSIFLILNGLFIKQGYLNSIYHPSLWLYTIVFGITEVYLYTIQPIVLKNSGFVINSFLLVVFTITTLYSYKKILKYKKEVKTYDETLEINPEDVTAWNNKGAITANFKAYNEAIEYFDKVLELEPEDAAALHNKGVVLTTFKRVLKTTAKANEYMDRALEADPGFEKVKKEGKIILET
jgi:tetratricopeptide (TPR) repeat protein